MAIKTASKEERFLNMHPEKHIEVPALSVSCMHGGVSGLYVVPVTRYKKLFDTLGGMQGPRLDEFHKLPIDDQLAMLEETLPEAEDELRLLERVREITDRMPTRDIRVTRRFYHTIDRNVRNERKLCMLSCDVYTTVIEEATPKLIYFLREGSANFTLLLEHDEAPKSRARYFFVNSQRRMREIYEAEPSEQTPLFNMSNKYSPAYALRRVRIESV